MKPITAETVVKKGPEEVWQYWTLPEHIERWNQASPDWECPHAENDIRVGGTFLSRMAARDGSASFDFTGTYTEVEPQKLLAYTMEDGRNVRVIFTKTEDGVHISETFDPENENPEEMQRDGWQAILNNFKRYSEAQ